MKYINHYNIDNIIKMIKFYDEQNNDNNNNKMKKKIKQYD